METHGWTRSLHQRIASAIRDTRRHHNLSQQQLAEQTSRLGYPITRDQIANYESGRKQSLDIAELLILADALNVPPLTLIFPGRPDRPIEATPTITMSTLDAVTRFIGDSGPLWPVHEVAALIERLNHIGGAIGGRGVLSVDLTGLRSTR